MKPSVQVDLVPRTHQTGFQVGAVAEAELRGSAEYRLAHTSKWKETTGARDFPDRADL